MKNWFFLVLLLAVTACNSGNNAAITTESVDISGYETAQVPGTNTTAVVKRNESGQIIEQGFLENGIKTGTWLIFEKKPFTFPNKVITYLNGVYNGPYYELNERGQIDLSAYYINNKLSGQWGKYKFGRPTMEASYKDGELDGVYKEFFLNDNKIQKEIHYRAGKQHGPYRFFNEAGEITLEYEYNNGEKVSGGIVEPKKPEASN
ncbi:MAG: hypothetical protein DHS20C18_40990 [Saprospiraceae bacterium]|nr:MAG: hypothetical protein DHS20C18_40990 [Saprospiraceae bacterium]